MNIACIKGSFIVVRKAFSFVNNIEIVLILDLRPRNMYKKTTDFMDFSYFGLKSF